MAMVHPIFSVLITRPELVMDHVAGYAALMQEEASTVGGHVARRVLAWGVAVISLLVFLVLGGVAIMLGAVYGQFHWTLVAVPAVALAAAIAAAVIATKQFPGRAFTGLKAQLDADAQALRTIGAGT
ncbi:MAG: hypothetical protein V4669_14245 [Pseudomonadota bacterium]